ncbi:MAG: hypothetical protein AAFQ68_06745, partial [Bacteroidota bacterium]
FTDTGCNFCSKGTGISEACFTDLDGPVVRVGSLDTPVPFHPDLEKQFMANARLESKLRDLLAF